MKLLLIALTIMVCLYIIIICDYLRIKKQLKDIKHYLWQMLYQQHKCEYKEVKKYFDERE